MSSSEGPAGNLRKRKSQTMLNSEKIATGQSTAMMKINARPTEHGQEMDKKLDEHETWVILTCLLGMVLIVKVRVWWTGWYCCHDGWISIVDV
jgi:delta24(24(1))-sterol reductase